MSSFKLPSAVARQGEAADAALIELQNQQDGITDSPGSGEPSGNTGVTNDGDTFNQADGGDPAIPGANGEGGKKAPPDNFDWKAEAEAMKAERDKAVNAFQALKGKYNAEVPRLTQEIRELRDRLQSIETTQKGNQQPGSGSTAQDDDSDAEFREMYGDVMADRLKRIKADAVAAAKAELEPRLRQVDDIERRAAQEATQGMFDAIAKEHKDWEEINERATWKKFLAEINPDTGETRQAAINRAQERLDPQPIIRQLSAFKRRVKAGNSALEGQVVPGDTGRTELPTERDEKVYSATTIDIFFKRQAINASKGLPQSEEEKRLNVLYTKAMLDGRVRPG